MFVVRQGSGHLAQGYWRSGHEGTGAKGREAMGCYVPTLDTMRREARKQKEWAGHHARAYRAYPFAGNEWNLRVAVGCYKATLGLIREWETLMLNGCSPDGDA